VEVVIMDALIGNWWLWIGVLALVLWALARFRRVPASQHAHGHHGETPVDPSVDSRASAPQRRHAGHGGGCCGGHGRH